MHASRRGLLSALLAVVLALAGRPVAASADPTAGTPLSNTATLTYENAAGEAFTATSNTIVTTIAFVSSLTLTPKEAACDPATDTFAVGTPLVKTFTILNSSNVPDAYTITAAQASAGTITGITFFTAATTTPATIGSTVSPIVAPGATIGVRVALTTAGVAIGGKILVALTARTTAGGTFNGLQSDSATQCALAALGATITGPQGIGTRVDKLVDGSTFLQTAPGASVTYTVSFKNAGAVAAPNAVLTDAIPSGVTPDLSSVRLNGNLVAATLDGNTLKVPAGTLQPGVALVVSFNATLTAGAQNGASLVNVASISADGAQASLSLPAAIWIGSGDIVYDGYAGSSQPIPNATIALVDAKTGATVPLGGASAQSSSSQPNASNANPFISGASGEYSFNLSANQLGAPTAPATYRLTVAAPGYLNRAISVTLTPDPSGVLYSATLKALDDQPLAAAGGFALTSGPVTLANVWGLFGNIPLFAKSVVQITKTVDRPIASAGDRLVWTVQFQSSALVTLGTTHVIDTLPAGIAYAPGTGRLDGKSVEPVRTGQVLTWTFPSLDTKQHTIVFASVLMPGTPEGSSVTNLASIDAAIPNAPGITVSANAQAAVAVIAGLYSSCTTLVGRVYLDTRKSGRFEPGDTGLPGIRIFLESGESVTTDPDGRFSFACVRGGMHVARIDTETLPASARPYADRRYDSERSIRRLIHGIFDGTTMQDVNFALEDTR
jgi:uncharacterized repeat protein (TIGR01451 family)